MQATITYSNSDERFVLIYNNKVILKSASQEYLQNQVTNQSSKKLIKLGIKSYKISGVLETRKPVENKPKFTIEQRFSFMRDFVKMVISKNAKSVIIAGAPGLGKTHTCLSELTNAGMIDVKSIVSNIESIDIDDEEQTIEDKILTTSNRPKGDYVIIKGYSTARAMYKLLYDNKDRIVIFDDCDSVLENATALNILKGALDSYDERWISWNSDRFGDSDVPQSFKFTGSIIFISNKKLSDIDEAVKSRAFKIDLSMTKSERLEHLKSCLNDITPEIDIQLKTEAFDFMASISDDIIDENSINFRTLHNVIKLRMTTSINDWKVVAEYMINEGNTNF